MFSNMLSRNLVSNIDVTIIYLHHHHHLTSKWIHHFWCQHQSKEYSVWNLQNRVESSLWRDQLFSIFILLASNWLEVIPGYENVILINFYWISSIVIRVYTRPLGIARCRSDTKSICPMLDGPTAIIIRTEFSFNRVRSTLMFLN